MNCRDCSGIHRDDRALVLLRALNGEPPKIGGPILLYGHRVAPIVFDRLRIIEMTAASVIPGIIFMELRLAD